MIPNDDPPPYDDVPQSNQTSVSSQKRSQSYHPPPNYHPLGSSTSGGLSQEQYNNQPSIRSMEAPGITIEAPPQLDSEPVNVNPDTSTSTTNTTNTVSTTNTDTSHRALKSLWKLLRLIKKPFSATLIAIQGTTARTQGVLALESDGSDILPITNEEYYTLRSSNATSDDWVTAFGNEIFNLFSAIYRMVYYNSPLVKFLFYLLVAFSAIQFVSLLGIFIFPFKSWEKSLLIPPAVSLVLNAAVTGCSTIGHQKWGEPLFKPVLAVLVNSGIINVLGTGIVACLHTGVSYWFPVAIICGSILTVIKNCKYVYLTVFDGCYQGRVSSFTTNACVLLAKDILHKLAPHDKTLKLTEFEERTLQYYIKYFNPRLDMPYGAKISSNMVLLKSIRICMSDNTAFDADNAILSRSRKELGLLVARLYCYPTLTTTDNEETQRIKIKDCTAFIKKPRRDAFPFRNYTQ